MSQNTKRLICIILAAILCLGLIASLIIPASAASVEYTYGSSEHYTNVIINWGQRGVDATFLSPNAESFYADNQVTYEQLAALSGTSTTENVPASALYAQLQELMASNHTTQTTYGNTRYVFCFTDCQNTDTSSISSFYSGASIGPEWDTGKTWNREHTWPVSKTTVGRPSNSDDGEASDIMTVRPTSTADNSGHSNKTFGTGSDCFDPKGTTYNLRGDVARIMLYTYVRWGNTQYMWGADGVIQSKEVLLAWMEEDPVDTWELARNDSVESITGTRNVFVDYPELAFVLFDEEIPADMTTPSGEAKNQPAKANWVWTGGKWYCYENGIMVKNEWRKDSKGWVFLGADGAMLTNAWCTDSKGWCYVGADGYCLTNTWKRDSMGWVYLDSEGSMVYDQWVQDSVGWCYVGADGYMLTNKWIEDSVGWCFIGADGYCVTDQWVMDSVGWCYLDNNGRMVYSQWVRDSIGWCYVGADGYMVTNQWVSDSNGPCYIGPNGYVV